MQPQHCWGKEKDHLTCSAGRNTLKTVPLTFFAARAHCWLLSKLLSSMVPKSFSAKLLCCWVVLVCTNTWGYSSAYGGLCTSPCWIFWDSCQPIFFSLWRSFWAIAQLPAYQPLLPVSCHQEIAEGALCPMIQTINEDHKIVESLRLENMPTVKEWSP